MVDPGAGVESVRNVSDVLLEAALSLQWVDGPATARTVLEDVVVALGGITTPARGGEPDALQLDLSFGVGEPLLPWAPPYSAARAMLERHLPPFVEAARRAVADHRNVNRLAEDATIDSLTTLANKRMLGRALGRLRAGEAVIMVDLDHFKQVNDTLGHDAGDRVLAAFGRVLQGTARARDVVGRYGGEEFVVILNKDGDPERFLSRLREEWETVRPQPVTFSAGVAVVAASPAATLEAADRAMYRAKQHGRNRWEWATPEDFAGGRPAATRQAGTRPAAADAAVPVPAERDAPAGFVAYSRLEVPAGAEAETDAAFGARLGAVDAWPGFRSLEVWADLAYPTSYVMVSWWDSAETFGAYMHSDDHRSSHDRIQTGPGRPRPRQFRRYRVVSR